MTSQEAILKSQNYKPKMAFLRVHTSSAVVEAPVKKILRQAFYLQYQGRPDCSLLSTVGLLGRLGPSQTTYVRSAVLSRVLSAVRRAASQSVHVGTCLLQTALSEGMYLRTAIHKALIESLRVVFLFKFFFQQKWGTCTLPTIFNFCRYHSSALNSNFLCVKIYTGKCSASTTVLVSTVLRTYLYISTVA